MKGHKKLTIVKTKRSVPSIWSMLKIHRKAVITCVVIIIAAVVVFLSLRLAHIRFMKKLYPRPYSSIVIKEAKENNIDPNLVYSVIKQESKFDPDVKSKAGAIGLMQLMPSTFEWLQKKESKRPLLASNSLYNPDVNIHYGCRFLSMLLKKYGSIKTALCAYNAGQRRVDTWLEDKSLSKDGKNLANVPFPETRNYANAVEENYSQYQGLYP